MGGLFYEKRSKSKIFETLICDKISVWLVNRFPKWYVMTPLPKNSQTSLGPWEWAFSRQGPGGGAHGASSSTQQYDFFAEQTLKISIYLIQWIKSYSIFTARQGHVYANSTLYNQPPLGSGGPKWSFPYSWKLYETKVVVILPSRSVNHAWPPTPTPGVRGP